MEDSILESTGIVYANKERKALGLSVHSNCCRIKYPMGHRKHLLTSSEFIEKVRRSVIFSDLHALGAPRALMTSIFGMYDLMWAGAPIIYA